MPANTNCASSVTVQSQERNYLGIGKSLVVANRPGSMTLPLACLALRGRTGTTAAGILRSTALSAEVDASLRRGFAHGITSLSGAAGMRFRYVPMMVSEPPAQPGAVQRLASVAGSC